MESQKIFLTLSPQLALVEFQSLKMRTVGKGLQFTFVVD